ncbi:HAUS2 protein, partial [Corythaeola cristata]|nr:HAUS2 protein [Corythaeola cristata]
TLDLTCRKAPCFVKFSEMEKMANIKAEINEVQPLLLSETADIAHPFYLGKCSCALDKPEALNDFISRLMFHLSMTLLEVLLSMYFYRYVVELLTEAVTFIEKLESHLQMVRSIPQIPNMMKNMDTALTKTEMLVMKLEEVEKQILKWRELQKEVYSD